MGEMLAIAMTAASCLSILFNTVLLPLIAFCSGPEIGNYKFLLLQYTIIAIVYSGTSLLFGPVLSPTSRGFLMYTGSNILSLPLAKICFVIFCACYTQLVIILTYSFLYRYFVFCRTDMMVWFTKKTHVAVLIVIYMIITFIWGSAIVCFMFPSPETFRVFAPEVYELTGLDLEHVPYFAAIMRENGELVPGTVILLGMYTFLILTCCVTITFCIYRTLGSFRKSASSIENLSGSKTMRLHKQLFILLILQTTAPILFTFLPVLASYLFAVVGVTSFVFPTYYSCLLPIAQVIDPLLIFYLVTDYRRAVLRCFRGKKPTHFSSNS